MPSPAAVCVYCGSSPGTDPAFVEAAALVGRTLAEAGIGVVYGGGSAGLMGTVATAALDAGGHVTGVLPAGLFPDGVTASPFRDHHAGTFHLVEAATMHERKATMETRADAFVALPGGIGTLEELAEILTWAQIGLHDKPVAVYDVNGYYGPLLTFLDSMVDHGLLSPDNRSLLRVATTPDELLAVVSAPGARAGAKWQ